MPRRCVRRGAPGSWYAVLNALSVMAVITNAFLVAFSSAWLYDLIYAGVQYLNVTVRARRRWQMGTPGPTADRLGACARLPVAVGRTKRSWS